jgi:hypothetical protein
MTMSKISKMTGSQCLVEVPEVNARNIQTLKNPSNQKRKSQ